MRWTSRAIARHHRRVAEKRRYLRVQAGYRGRLGVEIGVFVAVDHLRRAGRLTVEQEALYFDIDDWFNEHLPNPGFYADGNSVGAVTWFRDPVPAEMRQRVEQLSGILRAHEVACETAWSDDPGTVVYEDEYQVGVVPYVRGEPDPPPEGAALRPTTAGSKRAVAASPIRHVLFDADGVLQDVPGGWEAATEPYLGERTMEFLRRVWDDERAALAGQADLLPLIAAALADFGVTAPLEEVHRAIWLRIEPVGQTVALVSALRRNGYGVHLGTNQDRHRAAHMRGALSYDALFDVSCYSWEMGTRKPDPAFFAEAARRIGANSAAILFIDDSASNVTAARDAGLAAEQWTLADGHETLIGLLAKHGVPVS
jgi:HAD superfamily hydrolase (TIGR01509 family)